MGFSLRLPRSSTTLRRRAEFLSSSVGRSEWVLAHHEHPRCTQRDGRNDPLQLGLAHKRFPYKTADLFSKLSL